MQHFCNTWRLQSIMEPFPAISQGHASIVAARRQRSSPGNPPGLGSRRRPGHPRKRAILKATITLLADPFRHVIRKFAGVAAPGLVAGAPLP